MMEVKLTWRDNGTKILGYIGIVCGVLALIDETTVNLIATHLGPFWGPVFKYSCLIAGAYMVARRGHKNTSEIVDEIVARLAAQGAAGAPPPTSTFPEKPK